MTPHTPSMRQLWPLRASEAAPQRYLREGDRVFDTVDGVYYVRESVAVKKLNEKLNHALGLFENYPEEEVPRMVRALKETL